MPKTKAELQAENTALRELLTAIGEGLPPLPASDDDMDIWHRECSYRLSSIIIRAASAAALRADDPDAVAVLRAKAIVLREQWQEPLHYIPEGSQQPPKGSRPYPEDDAWLVNGPPYPPGPVACEAVSEVGTPCTAPAGHPLAHIDPNGFEWGAEDEPVDFWPSFYGPAKTVGWTEGSLT